MTAVAEPLTTGNVTPPPIADDAGWIDVYLQLPDLVARDWRRQIDAALAAEGGIAALHAARSEVLQRYDRMAAALEKVAAFAASQNRRDRDALTAAAEKLRTFTADLARRWAGELELEDVICRAITPPAEELRRKLAKLPGPPQWWWEMDHKKPW